MNSHAQPLFRIILPHLRRAAYLRAPYQILANTPSNSPLERLNYLIVDYSSLNSWQTDLTVQPAVSDSDDLDLFEREASLMKDLHSTPNLRQLEALSLEGPR